ncbi:hypothetical protein POVWA2_042470 [Plasmodium ovale wallikeri]|uniref:Uncharacterized protein n=1 Tax=Plasmodium ovale wallikeri TaxID=864142 RepID=A0A1A8ZC65_PLAOA|nr:hypothetical protein POVWA1_043950 [Plasmodium ovale wallikeri]SBT41776.1 hypothetical protein POVWA2_042470 [Plasmodium ovale wallikeri]
MGRRRKDKKFPCRERAFGGDAKIAFLISIDVPINNVDAFYMTLNNVWNTRKGIPVKIQVGLAGSNVALLSARIFSYFFEEMRRTKWGRQKGEDKMGKVKRGGQRTKCALFKASVSLLQCQKRSLIIKQTPGSIFLC